MISNVETEHANEISSINLRRFWRPEILLLLLAVALYFILHNIYRVANVDDAWSLSFAYNYLFKHISSDVTFGATTGGCGVMYFGKTYAYLYGAILDALGWTKSNALYISTLFVGLSSIVWYFIIWRLTRLRKFAFIFAVLMVIIEPFFEAANEARPDALTFLLVSIAFLAIIEHKPFLAGITAMVAFETHPMGIIAFFYVFSAIVTNIIKYGFPKGKIVSKTILFIMGVGLGILYFFLLHYHFLGTLVRSVTASNTSHQVFSNLFTGYFFNTGYARHLPELLLILISMTVFIKRKYYQSNPHVLVLLVVLTGLLLFVKRPNFRYIIYIYPVFLLLILETFRRLNRLKLAVLIYMVLILPPYTCAFVYHRNYNQTVYIHKIETAVPHDQLPVVGGSDDWFAFKERRFYTTNYDGKFKKLNLKEFYFIENKNYRHDEFPQLESIIEHRYNGKAIARFTVNHEHYRVLLEQAKFN